MQKRGSSRNWAVLVTLYDVTPLAASKIHLKFQSDVLRKNYSSDSKHD